MAGHSFTENDIEKFEPLPEGEYECVIENIEKNTFIEKTGVNAGKENIYLTFTYKVRDDLNPAINYAGRKINFQSIFPKYDNDKKQFVQSDGWVNYATLLKILRTQEDKNGYKTDFSEGIDEFILYMMNKTLVCVVGIKQREYNGEIKVENVVKGWKKSNKGDIVKGKNTVTYTEVPDEELPF